MNDENLSFTAPTPPAFTPPPAPPIEGTYRNGDPFDANANGVFDHAEDAEDAEDAATEPPAPHADSPGLGVTGKFPAPQPQDDEQ